MKKRKEKKMQDYESCCRLNLQQSHLHMNQMLDHMHHTKDGLRQSKSKLQDTSPRHHLSDTSLEPNPAPNIRIQKIYFNKVEIKKKNIC